MKYMIFFILILTPLFVWPQYQQNDKTFSGKTLNNSNSNETSKSDTIKSTINHLGLYFDSGITARSGTENVLLLHHGFSRLEDKIIGTKWTSENTFLKKSGGILGRFAKYVFLDIPANFLFHIGNHEFFGHGARYREFDLGVIDYHFDPPAPYGVGGGYANVSNYSRAVSDHERIAIWIGGFETHNILNRQLSLRWVSDGKSRYQENILYFWSWQDKFQYIQTNLKSLPADLNGPLNDPEGYVYFLNRNSGFDDPDNLKLDIADLQRKNLVNLVNPFVWYSFYGQFVSYLYGGNTTVGLPMLKFGEIEYLPSLRMSLTPYGPQYHLENYIKWRRTVSLFDISIGDQTFYQDWWALGVQTQNFYENERLSLDFNLNIWKQPGLEYLGNIVNSNDRKIGLAFSVRGFYDIIDSYYPISIITEVGYKTPGFLQGYVLDASPIIRLGLGIKI